jgi:hypothetical protein
MGLSREEVKKWTAYWGKAGAKEVEDEEREFEDGDQSEDSSYDEDGGEMEEAGEEIEDDEDLEMHVRLGRSRSCFSHGTPMEDITIAIYFEYSSAMSDAYSSLLHLVLYVSQDPADVRMSLWQRVVRTSIFACPS